ncbi:SRPBCC family protein [Sphingobacterium sp. HJSM2_6]|uniref:SRPBCC family protein n=1 Tax=Sphingobacterium sp. HJSM2_6 TaxID=3366264 RepID=UPI003BD46494
MEHTNKTLFKINENQVIISRDFKGTLDQIWRAYTDHNLTDQWFAPQPWKCTTKEQSFEVGGIWLYAMNGPAGEKHWAMFRYEEIIPLVRYSGFDAFSDENGQINSELPTSKWNTEFFSNDSYCTVVNTCTFSDQQVLKEYLDLGFKEGYEQSQFNLDNLLLKLA